MKAQHAHNGEVLASAGVHRVEPTPEPLAFVERTFVETAAPDQREPTRAEALAELTGSDLVLEPAGSVVNVVSRANSTEWLPLSGFTHNGAGPPEL